MKKGTKITDLKQLKSGDLIVIIEESENGKPRDCIVGSHLEGNGLRIFTETGNAQVVIGYDEEFEIYYMGRNKKHLYVNEFHIWAISVVISFLALAVAITAL